MTTMQMNAQIQQGLTIIQNDEGMMRQVAQYVQKLVKQFQKREKKAVAEKKHYEHEDLCGIIAGVEQTDRELIDEYLEEKYGV